TNSNGVSVGIGVLQCVALHHVQILINEISRHVEPRSAVEVRHIDDQCVSFPAAARISIPGPVVSRMGTVVQRDDSRLVYVFIKDSDDGVRIWRWFGGSRHAGQMAAWLTVHVLVHLAPSLFKYRLGQVRDPNTAQKTLIR